MNQRGLFGIVSVVAVVLAAAPLWAADSNDPALDKRVRAFLDAHRGDWHDMNVPEVDGRLLHDLIVERGFTRALEIGTSTGHSAIWIAWALSKTGGRLITIEIDETRHREAVKNFEEAGLSDLIDARLANAHELVPTLEGPFDFVFSDADKDWYTRYFEAVAPKLTVGGCFAAHNATMRQPGIREFLEYIEGLPDFETRIDRSSRAGVSISCKTAGADRR
jgi:predicted O-methyltransferase YrrM